MLTRIMADELKALIDKWTEPEKSPDMEEKIKDDFYDFYIVQRSDGLFWGGKHINWVPQVSRAMCYAFEAQAYLFHGDYFNSDISRKYRLKVLTHKEACACEGKSF